MTRARECSEREEEIDEKTSRISRDEWPLALKQLISILGSKLHMRAYMYRLGSIGNVRNRRYHNAK